MAEFFSKKPVAKVIRVLLNRLPGIEKIIEREPQKNALLLYNNVIPLRRKSVDDNETRFATEKETNA